MSFRAAVFCSASCGLMNRVHRWLNRIGLLFACLLGLHRLTYAAEQTSERVTEHAGIDYRRGHTTAHASGTLSGDAQRLRGGVQRRRIGQTPLVIGGESRFEQEKRLPYDVRRWGGQVHAGLELNETTDLSLSYRLDSYQVFNTGANVDPAFRNVSGRT